MTASGSKQQFPEVSHTLCNILDMVYHKLETNSLTLTVVGKKELAIAVILFQIRAFEMVTVAQFFRNVELYTILS